MNARRVLTIVLFGLLATPIILLVVAISDSGMFESSHNPVDRRDAYFVQNAIKAFYNEYSMYPLEKGVTNTTTDHEYREDYKDLFATLQGINTNQNPRGIVFIEIDTNRLDSEQRYVDSRNHPFHVVADWNYDSKLLVGTQVLPKGVAVWSDGPNGQNDYGQGDDLRTW
jgi:hypothetical protein